MSPGVRVVRGSCRLHRFLPKIQTGTVMSHGNATIMPPEEKKRLAEKAAAALTTCLVCQAAQAGNGISETGTLYQLAQTSQGRKDSCCAPEDPKSGRNMSQKPKLAVVIETAALSEIEG